MPSIHRQNLKGSRLIYLEFFICIVLPSLSSCAYRLTNLHIKNPHDISTIAVESVFDTGGQVLPHEHLWDQLQRAFAANGHLKLTSVSQADALVRAHIRQASTIKSGQLSTRDRAKEKTDPDIYTSSAVAPSADALRDLSTASELYTKDNTSFVVDIEVWHLETRKLLLQRTYSGASDIFAIRPEVSNIVFLRHEEALDRNLATVANQIAETVVNDLLVR